MQVFRDDKLLLLCCIMEAKATRLIVEQLRLLYDILLVGTNLSQHFNDPRVLYRCLVVEESGDCRVEAGVNGFLPADEPVLDHA